MKKPARPPIEEMLAVVTRLDGGPASYDFELTSGEFEAIGRLTVQWAFLETVIGLKTASIAHEAQLPLPADAHNFSFARRLRAFRKLAERAVQDPGELDIYRRQVPRIARLAGQRQRVAHHIWHFNPRAPEKIWAISFREPASRAEPFDLGKLHHLATQMGEVAYTLLHPEKPNPSAFEVLIGEGDQQGAYAYVSRDFLLRMSAGGKKADGP